MRELTGGEIHLLKLISKEAKEDGWAKVSDAIMTVVHPLPRRLVEVEENRARLTEEGRGVVAAMPWLGYH